MAFLTRNNSNQFTNLSMLSRFLKYQFLWILSFILCSLAFLFLITRKSTQFKNLLTLKKQTNNKFYELWKPNYIFKDKLNLSKY